jgi:uncharacterized protein (AIM24 family)
VRGILAEAGAMVWMTPGDVTIETSLSGGELKAIKRVLASETAFVNMFSGSSGSLALAPDFPCDILELPVRAGESLELAAGAFLACEDGLAIIGRLTLLGGLIGQTDLVGALVENATSQTRKVWVAGNGATKAHVLAREADRLCVDNHRVLACSPGTKSEFDRAGSGLVSAVFGGEGIVTCFSGPGTVWTQTRRSFPYLIEKVAASRDSGGMTISSPVAGDFGADDDKKDDEASEEDAAEEDAAEEAEGNSEGGGGRGRNRKAPRMKKQRASTARSKKIKKTMKR